MNTEFLQQTCRDTSPFSKKTTTLYRQTTNTVAFTPDQIWTWLQHNPSHLPTLYILPSKLPEHNSTSWIHVEKASFLMLSFYSGDCKNIKIHQHCRLLTSEQKLDKMQSWFHDSMGKHFTTQTRYRDRHNSTKCLHCAPGKQPLHIWQQHHPQHEHHTCDTTHTLYGWSHNLVVNFLFSQCKPDKVGWELLGLLSLWHQPESTGNFEVGHASLMW